MIDFLEALADPQTPFVRMAVWASLLACPALGIAGTWVVTRRLTSLAGAIAHAALGGIGMALYAQRVLGWEWADPSAGAMVAAVVSACILSWVRRSRAEREDTIVTALWTLGMAVGLVFLARTPGYADPMSYLFGNILLVTQRDLIMVTALDLAWLLAVIRCHRQWQALWFDEEYARTRGLAVSRHYLAVSVLIGLTVVVLIKVAGTILVLALLALPAALAGMAARQLWQMMIGATFLAALAMMSGLTLSYEANWPTGPAIILPLGAIYLAATLLRGHTKRRGQVRPRTLET